MAMLVIDLEHMILPDQLQIILYALGLLFVWFEKGTLHGVGGALISSLVYSGLAFALAMGGRFFLKRDALGMGDVKFFAVAGLWLGLAALPVFMLVGGVLGVILGLIWKHYVKQDAFPFGPALIASFFLLILLRAPQFSSALGPFLGGFPGLS
jgi:prepilin signal peptidase PulO-like enzyme (type II secretory pathway)